MLLRTSWLRAHLVVTRAQDAALWRVRLLETLATDDPKADALRREVKSDFETIRAHGKDLFAGASGRTFSFYGAPAREGQITLGSPVGLIRDIAASAEQCGKGFDSK